MITIEGYCLKIIILDKKWIVFVRKVMNKKLQYMIAQYLVMIFEYLRPQGAITLSIDRKCNIPIVDIKLDAWYENSVSP